MRAHDDAGLCHHGHEKIKADNRSSTSRLMQAFAVLHRIQWSIPWAEDRSYLR